MQSAAGAGTAKLALAVAFGALSHKAATLLIDWLRQRQSEAPEAAEEAAPSGKKAKKEKVPIPGVEQTLSLLRERRTILPKDYNGKGRAPTDDEIQMLLEGANWAPTHKRTEPWRFVVFRGPAAIKQVLDATAEGTRAATTEERGGETFEQWNVGFLDDVKKRWGRCDVLISLSMLREAVPGKRNPEWEEIAATACAVQNMHLVATALGLAGYWSSWHTVGRDSDAMAKCLGISKADGDRCLGFFCIGSSDLVGRVRAGRGPVAEKTRWV